MGATVLVLDLALVLMVKGEGSSRCRALATTILMLGFCTK